MSRDRGKYQAYVTAETPEEAIAIVAEALPKHTEIVEQAAEAITGTVDTIWHVTLSFRRLEKEKGEY